jgi:RNA polymerase sigma-70 factor (ECF subfamily)
MTNRSATATPVLPSPRGTVLPGEGADWTPPSWDDVVREHADRVYRLAYRLTGNPHDAEDLTQETFIRVFRSLADYKPGTFEGWLHRITTNLFLDMVRRRARLRMEGLPEDSDRLPGGGPEPEQVFSDTHLDPVLQAALDELAPEFRAAVVLCDVEGTVVRGDRCHPGGETRYRAEQDPPGTGRAARRARAARRFCPGGRDEGRSGGRRMTGERRFSLSSPDWGQAHLSLDAIVAYVDDELSPGAQTRAQEHLDSCGECRAEVGAQRQDPRRLARRRRPVPAVVPAPQPAVDPGRGRAAPDAARSRRHRGRAVRPAARRSAGLIPVRARRLTSTTSTPPPVPAFPRPASAPARSRRRGGSPAARGSARCRASR